MPHIDPQEPGWRSQYILQLIQVFFVGLTLGMTRTVVPAVAESDFGVHKGDLALIATFVIAFGVVKGVMNFVAGALSETLGRKRVLVLGWLIAMPIPWMVFSAPSAGGWTWIVAATVLLGINQGLTWSMTLTSKLDLTRPERRGLTNGLNEFAGYSAVAIAGIVTAYLSNHLGARRGLLVFGCATIPPALMMALLLVRETHMFPNIQSPSGVPTTRSVFALSLRNRTFFALCQAGLIEKFIDALMWIVLPVYLVQCGVDLRDIGWAPGLYAMTWGCSQLVTGPLSDRIGCKPLIVCGMLLCTMGVALLPIVREIMWWNACASMTGLGMGMLYPTLGAAVSDFAANEWRATALGVYRFWRDLGYAIGAGMLSILALMGCTYPVMFLAIALCVGVSALVTLVMTDEPERSRKSKVG